MDTNETIPGELKCNQCGGTKEIPLVIDSEGNGRNSSIPCPKCQVEHYEDIKSDDDGNETFELITDLK